MPIQKLLDACVTVNCTAILRLVLFFDQVFRAKYLNTFFIIFFRYFSH